MADARGRGEGDTAQPPAPPFSAELRGHRGCESREIRLTKVARPRGRQPLPPLTSPPGHRSCGRTHRRHPPSSSHPLHSSIRSRSTSSPPLLSSLIPPFLSLSLSRLRLLVVEAPHQRGWLVSEAFPPSPSPRPLRPSPIPHQHGEDPAHRLHGGAQRRLSSSHHHYHHHHHHHHHHLRTRMRGHQPFPLTWRSRAPLRFSLAVLPLVLSLLTTALSSPCVSLMLHSVSNNPTAPLSPSPLLPHGAHLPPSPLLSSLTALS